MRCKLSVTLLVSLLVLMGRREVNAQLPPPRLPAPMPPQAPAGQTDEILLQSAGLSTDGPGLLEFCRLRSAGPTSAEKLKGLIEQLGADAVMRDRACAELVALGPPAIPVLRQAVKDPDQSQTASLAGRCLAALENGSANLTSAAVRVLARRHPEGVAEALLGLLPVAEDESVIEEIKRALLVVGFAEGKLDPALERALEDKVSIRRATAIEVLCTSGRAEPRPVLRRLLHDPTPSVRLRAALTLAAGHDSEAIPVLLQLLGEVPLVQGRQIEDFLQTLAGEHSPKIVLADDEVSRKNCHQAWSNWWQNPPPALTNAALLEELHKRTLAEADRRKIQSLVANLGDDEFAVREKAMAGLRALGKTVVPVLKVAAHSPDLEVSQRATALLHEMEKQTSPPLDPIVPRLLALRKPAGAAEALLAFLPFAEEDGTRAEVQLTLNVLAGQQGKPDPALVRALEDRAPVRRGAAAEALCQASSAEHLPAVRKLLKDPEASVRMQTALALASLREREAIPVLIALVGELPDEQESLVEDYLRRLSADRPPADLPAGTSLKSEALAKELRKKRQEAWAAWWDAEGSRVQLPQRTPETLSQRYLGYTLLVQPQNNQVVELDQTGKVRWQLGGLLGPQDAQMLPGERVLVAEYNAQRVTERNLKGEIVWQKAVPGQPIGVQRLANGNTLIVLRNLLLEVDRTGREVSRVQRPLPDLMFAHKTRDGQVVCISNQGTCFRLDRAGKEVKSFRVQGVSGFGNEVLANGHILVPVSWQSRLIEYDTEGKVVWETQVQQAFAATRLPNGHTLVASQQWPARLIEVDRTGKQVAQINTTAYTVRIHRR